jgi:hypothetical protein
MDLNEIDPSIWAKLAITAARDPMKVTSEQLTGSGTSKNYVCIFTSKDGSFHLLLSPESEPQELLIDPQVAGLKLGILKNHSVTGRERQDYIDLRCAARPHIDTFTEIVREISKSILNDNLPPRLAVNLTIRRWKSFWGKAKEGILSESDQLGLMGELYIIEALIKKGISNPINGWSNPENARHDFEFPSISLEVKTTLKSRHQHIINGLEQLETLNDRPLFIISLLAQNVDDGGFSILEMVNKVRSHLEKYPDKYEDFNERIALRGYRPDHESYYEKTRFKIQDVRIFPVNNDFPKLISDSLLAPLSPRVTEIRYMLDCEGLACITFDKPEFLAMFDRADR